MMKLEKSNIGKHMVWFSKCMLKKQFILCAILFVLTELIMLVSPTQHGSMSAYEDLMLSSNVHAIFVGAIIVCVGFMVFDLARNVVMQNGKSVLLMLPGKRREVYIALMLFCTLSVLMVFATQLLALIIAYVPTMAVAQSSAELYASQLEMELLVDAGRTNGLYLAMITSDLFRLLLPQSLVEFGVTLSFLLYLGVLPAFICLCASKVEIGVFAVGLIVGFNFLLRQLTVSLSFDTSSFASDYIYPMLLLLFLSGWMVFSGIRKLNESANLR